MRKAKAKSVYMVEGEVVHGSRGMWIALLVIACAIALVGLGIRFSGWKEISLWGIVLVESPIVVSATALLVGLILGILAVYKLMEGGRIILGSDRMQFVTARGRFLTQLPYQNIDNVELVDVKMEDPGLVVKHLHIDMHDSNDPETVIQHGSVSREAHGCDCMFDPAEFVLSAEQLHERIQTHIQKFHDRH